MKIINPPTLAAPRGYSNGVLVPPGDLLFVAGQIGWDPQGRLADGFVAQFARALANVVDVVEAAGGTAASIAKLTIFVADRAEYVGVRSQVGAAYRHLMGKHFPAMSLVEVAALLDPGARVEIEAIAVIRPRSTLDTDAASADRH
jgi:enamine deaminase RidA (YjgF/YER057c/UK114 family)